MKISVVVSVYNTGEYLPKAMESLLAQTCTDYEILLVDDGSTDGSGEECERQAAGRENVRVFHKENGGLSSARNYGIDHAAGDYIIFPDPDDWVEPEYLATLLALTEETDAGLSICGHYENKEHKDRRWDTAAERSVLSTDEALELVMQNRSFCGFAWNKLYHMDLIREHNLRFDEELGMVQDLHFAVRYISLCRQVAYDPVPLYHYCRDNGGVTQFRCLGARELSGLTTYEKIAEIMQDTHPRVADNARASLCEMSLRFMSTYIRSGSRDPETYDLLRRKFRQNRKYFFRSRRFGTRHKCAAFFAAYSPRIYFFLASTLGHMRKKREHKGWRYIRLVFLHVILFLPARILRIVHPRYRALWLVSERGYDARDNGSIFFRYLCKEHPEINAVYVIDRESPDHERVASAGACVDPGSIRHRLMYLAADRLIGTHAQPAAPDHWAYYRLGRFGIRAPGRQAFLDHGIIKDDIRHMHYPQLRVDLFVCGAKPEYDYVSSVYGHPEGVVQYTGLPRYDALYGPHQRQREILVMPTWRSSDYPSGEAFLQTAFYKHYQAFLNSPELQELLERTDHRLIFYPHTELQKELHRFTSPSDRIVLADQAHYDVQTLLIRCVMLITDYSSVYFDVGYQGKPVIYYQFDKEEYRSKLYREGYFSYERDGFGPVVENGEDLICALTACAESGFRQPALYAERVERFFPMRDDKNCERTYRAILGLSGKGGKS